MSHPFSLLGKTILITGASSGIGKICAIECSKQGASLVLLGRDRDRLLETKSLLSEGQHSIYDLDITSDFDFKSLLDDVVSQQGKISGFIHCAGKELTLPFKNSTKENFSDLFDVNVFAGFEIARLLSLKKYRAEKQSLVFIASISGVVGEVGKVIYSASKGAIISGVQSLAMEMAKQQVRVNAISPAMVKTPLMKTMFANIGEEAHAEILKKHPLGFGDPEDVAQACIYLLSDAAKWITGSNLIIDGGYSVH